MLRWLAYSLIGALWLGAGPASACVPYMYEGVVVEARTRSGLRPWQPVHIETDRSLIRVDFPSGGPNSRSVTVIGDIGYLGDFDWAYRIAPTTAPGSLKKIRMGEALRGSGIEAWMLARYAPYAAPQEDYRKWRCQLADPTPWRDPRSPHFSKVCVRVVQSEAEPGFGFPLYATDSRGRRVFEVISLRQQRVPLSRFNPASLNKTIVAARSPTTCSG